MINHNINNNRVEKFLTKVKIAEVNNLYPIGIIGVRISHTFVGKVIKFFQNDPYHHVEFLLSDGKTTLASRNGIGVNFYTTDDMYVKDKYDVFYFDKEFNDEQKKLFYNYLKNILINDLTYDYLSVLSVIFPKLIKISKGSYCSEMIYNITKFCKYPLVNNNHELFNNVIYPSDICKSIRLVNSYRI